MTLQITLEIIRTVFIALLFYYTSLSKAKMNNGVKNSGWTFVQVGIIFIFFGSTLDITANVPYFQNSLILGDSNVNMLIKSLLGYIPGIALAVIGFGKWVPKVQQAEKKSNELEKSNKKINKIKGRLDTILKSIGDAIIAVDTENKIILINPEAQKITGWTESQALGKSLKSVYRTDEEIAIENSNIIDTLLEDYALETSFKNIKIEDKFGEKRLVSSTVTPMLEGDELSGMVVIFREVEFLEKIQKRLTQKQKMESLSIFANGVAHDFNNQLTGVQGFCELLESEISDEEQLDYISEIRKAVDRSIDLTDRLLSFARKEEPRNQVIDVSQSVREIVESFETDKIKIETDISDKILNVEGNQPRLKAVFSDILNNSIDSIPEKGLIKVKVSHEVLDEEFLKYYPYAISVGEYVCYKVIDNGIGMNPEVLEKVYEPFFTTSRRSYGKGMGLASVYGTVSRHDGLITIRSEEGVGTEVNVYLPIISTEHKEENESDIKSGIKTIMVIDDEEFIRFYVKKELERNGYKVKVFEDGESALKFFERHPDDFSAAVIDCVMPKISGIQTMRKLKEFNSDFRVLLMSGKLLEKDDEKIIGEVVKCEFLRKPFDGPTLINYMDLILGDN